MGRFADWFLGREGPVHLERVEPLEGTNMSPVQLADPGVLAGNLRAPGTGHRSWRSRVWVANRCQQLNAQQIAGMPLVFHGPPAEDTEPAWVSARIRTGIRTGSVTPCTRSSTSCTGGGSPACTSPTGTRPGSRGRGRCCRQLGGVRSGWRTAAAPTSSARTNLNPARVVQIDRNPATGLQGTSALSAYAQQAWGLLAAGNQSLAVSAMAGSRRRC